MSTKPKAWRVKDNNSSVLRIQKSNAKSSSKITNGKGNSENPKTTNPPSRTNNRQPPRGRRFDIINMPLSFYIFVAGCATFVVCFLIRSLFLWTTIFGVITVFVICLASYFGLNIASIISKGKVEMDRNRLELQGHLEIQRQQICNAAQELQNRSDLLELENGSIQPHNIFSTLGSLESLNKNNKMDQ